MNPNPNPNPNPNHNKCVDDGDEERPSLPLTSIGTFSNVMKPHPSGPPLLSILHLLPPSKRSRGELEELGASPETFSSDAFLEKKASGGRRIGLKESSS